MELKRILARDTRSAMEKAIKTYGPDVLVISNHQVGGQTELVVAIEAPTVTQAQLAPAPTEFAPPVPSVPEAPLEDFRQTLQAASQAARASEDPAAAISAPTAAVATPRPPAPTEQDARDYLRSREIVDLVRDEIAALRREFRMRQQASAWQSGLNFAPEIMPLAQALQDSQMPGALLMLLLDGLRPARDVREGLALLREQLLHPTQRPVTPMPQRGLHLLAGPSGAGKTSMVARLARRAAQTGSDKVALISLRDVRAGAWSQMQMLAAQLGVDAYRAHDMQSLQLLLDELSHRDLVLIDTPGVQMADHLREVLALAPHCQIHAVLPVDASAATLQRVFDQGAPFKSLLLSKKDEASSAWALIQFISNNPQIGLSGISHGAGLDDLASDFDSEHLVDFALTALSKDLESSLGMGPWAPASASPLQAAASAVLEPAVQPAFVATAEKLGLAADQAKPRSKAKSAALRASETAPAKKRTRTVSAAAAKTAPARAVPTEKKTATARPRRKSAEATVHP